VEHANDSPVTPMIWPLFGLPGRPGLQIRVREKSKIREHRQ
jgi:hypothetical protein